MGVVTRIAAENKGKARLKATTVTESMELPAGVSPAANALLEKLDGCRLTAGAKRVVLDYPQIVEDEDHLRAGAELVASMATPNVRGVYR